MICGARIGVLSAWVYEGSVHGAGAYFFLRMYLAPSDGTEDSVGIVHFKSHVGVKFQCFIFVPKSVSSLE